MAKKESTQNLSVKRAHVYYPDIELNYVNAGFKIEFTHIPSGVSVWFKALLTEFDDGFESDWKEEDVYGRMDTIDNFRGTKRLISLGWDLVAASEEEAQQNLQKASLLLSMLYPAYHEGAGTSVISAAPLFKLSFLNLIQNVGIGAANTLSPKKKEPGKKGSKSSNSGLVGKVSGFHYGPDLEQGMFYLDGKAYPQTINLSCTYSVKHTHKLGWGSNKWLRDNVKFPYNEEAPDGIKQPQPEQTNGDNESMTDSQKQAAQNIMLSAPLEGTIFDDKPITAVEPLEGTIFERNK